MNLQAVWDAAKQQITLSKDNNALIMTVGSTKYTFNSVEHDLTVTPTIIDGRTQVPLEPVVDSFGGTFRIEPITEYKIVIDKKEFVSDIGFYEYQGRALASIDCIAAFMGAQVYWDLGKQQIAFILGDKTLVMTLNSTNYIVNGESKIMDSTPIIYKDKVCVPILYSVEALGSVCYIEKPATQSVDECFIATAAFGSKFEPAVVLLRHFRDQYLLTNKLGTAFVKFYYHNSPPIAAFISKSEPLKALVRVLLIPFIAVVYLIYHPILGFEVVGVGALIVLLIRSKRRLNLS